MKLRQCCAVFTGVLMVGGLMGCVTSHKDFDPKKVKPTQGIVIGKVDVIYNSKKFNPNCRVCLGSGKGSECQKLSDEGLVFMALEKGVNEITRFECQDVSPQAFTPSGVVFEVKEGVQYIGNAKADWKNAGGFKASSMFGLIGALVDESSNDGILTVSVSDQGYESVKSAYQNQIKAKNLNVGKSLIQVRKN